MYIETEPKQWPNIWGTYWTVGQLFCYTQAFKRGGISLVSTCCSISDALMDPSLSSLSGDGKLRKEDTSGGREEGAGVDNYDKRKVEEKKIT